MMTALTKTLEALSSLWLTLALLVWVVGVLALDRIFGVSFDMTIGRAVAFPFFGLFVNLVAAVAVRPLIRQQAGLLVFHLALAAIALFAAGGQFFALNGQVEVTEGGMFDPAQVEAKAGFLHPWGINNIEFLQGSFSINYAPSMKRRDTASQIFLKDASGAWQPHIVGDDTPLVIEGYRFYTTFNKGFAPILTYQDRNGQSHTGSIHLPSYPLNEYNQGNAWTPPDGSTPIDLWLSIKEPVYIEDGAWQFDLPKDPILIVEAGGKRSELKPGESVDLYPGQLRFEDVRTWMGYKIFYDPAMAWMLAAAFLAVSGLGWHTFVKLRSTPWDAAPSHDKNQGLERQSNTQANTQANTSKTIALEDIVDAG